MTIENLKSLPLFANVSTDLLLEILPRLCHRTFLHGHCLFTSGSYANEVFVILHGSVCIERDDSFLVSRCEHDLVGEQALLAQDGSRTATARAQGLVTALLIPKEVFNLLLEVPSFSLNLARILSEKLTQATTDRGYRYSKEALVFGEFRSHVAPEVLDKLIQDGEAYCGPRNADVVVLFSDIREFTSRSTEIAPEEVARDLTAYLNHVVELIHKHGGMVDKFVGDAIMAVWGGFEVLNPSICQQAFDCACRMVETAHKFNFGGKPIRIGIGLNAGTVFIGNIGGDGKRQFTVLGSAVNLASRFEAETKNLKQPIVLGLEVAQLLPPGVRQLLYRHAEVEIKGVAPQDLYSFNPIMKN